MATSYTNRNINDCTYAELQQLANRKALATEGAPQFDHFATECNRCGGRGGWAGWPGYTCFRCAGECFDPTDYKLGLVRAASDEWKVAAQAVLDKYFASADKRAAKRVAEAAAAKAEHDRLWASIVATDTVIADAVAFVATGNAPEIVASILGTCERTLNVSDAQRAALSKIMADEAAKAERPEIVEGRQTVVGTVRKIKETFGQFGTQWKAVIILDNGNVLYGTHGSKFPQVGERVQFDAAIERSKDDVHFGFYKRPTKVQVGC